MYRCLFFLLLFAACQAKPGVNNAEEIAGGEDSLAESIPVPKATVLTPTDTLLLLQADSVLLASHHSPNYPRRDSSTGKYFPRAEIIENDSINYDIIIEKKKLSKRDIKKLSSIIFRPATRDDKVRACFQPRHAIFVFRNGQISSLDICFDCGGAAATNEFHHDIEFDDRKYEEANDFFRRQGFKYEL